MLLTIGQSCSSRNAYEEERTVEYPRIEIQDSLLPDEPILYDLTDEFVEAFLQSADNFEGTPMTMQVNRPQEWGMVGWEQLPEGKELWLVQSKNREWTYLVITSGAGTQRIKDLILIGLDVATGGVDYNERELWTWKRDDDGFIVDKYYEMKRDVRDTASANKTTHVQDKYVIGNMGLFEYIPLIKEDTSNYQAVIAYDDCLETLEEWAEVLRELEPYCEEHNIFFKTATCNFKNVGIQDYKMMDVANFDITPYMSEGKAGLVLIAAGNQPIALTPDDPDYLKKKINKYFQIK